MSAPPPPSPRQAAHGSPLAPVSNRWYQIVSDGIRLCQIVSDCIRLYQRLCQIVSDGIRAGGVAGARESPPAPTSRLCQIVSD
eukprot:630817-Pyramimonas_sp.AAC.1